MPKRPLSPAISISSSATSLSPSDSISNPPSPRFAPDLASAIQIVSRQSYTSAVSVPTLNLPQRATRPRGTIGTPTMSLSKRASEALTRCDTAGMDGQSGPHPSHSPYGRHAKRRMIESHPSFADDESGFIPPTPSSTPKSTPVKGQPSPVRRPNTTTTPKTIKTAAIPLTPDTPKTKSSSPRPRSSYTTPITAGVRHARHSFSPEYQPDFKPDFKPEFKPITPNLGGSKARIPVDAKRIIAEELIVAGAGVLDVSSLSAKTGLTVTQVRSQISDNRNNVRKQLVVLARGLQ